MLTTLCILILSAIFFVSGKIRSDIVALCALVALLIFHILTPEEALSGFSNSVVIMMVGLFVVGGAIFQTGLAKMLSSRILKLAGNSELRLFILIMAVTSAIGAFVSNTGTVALMLPIVVSLAASNPHMNASRLLMPLAFASSMGGMMTLIGTPPNLVIQNTLTDAGYPSLSFFSFLPVGLICVVVGTIVLLPLSKIFLSKRGAESRTGKHSGKSLKELVHEYGLSDNLFRLRIPAKSVLKGKTIVDLDIRRRYGLNILEVRRGEASQHRFLKTITQKLAEPNTILQAEDILYVKGDFEQVNAWAAAHRLEILDGRASEDIRRDRSLDFYDIGIAEIVLMPASRIVNHTIKEIGFRDKFNVNVLGIRRKKEYLLQDLGDLRIHSGDVLLIQGTWSDISRLSKEDEDWVVLGEPLDEAAKVTLDYKAPLAAAIMILMVAMMVFDFIPVAPVTAVMIAGILMVLTGCFRNVEAAYKLGKHRADCRHASHVVSPGKNGRSRVHIQQPCQRLGQLRPVGTHGRNLFHDLPDDHVHQQYGDGRIAGSHSLAKCATDWCKPSPLPVCRHPRCQHVLRVPVFYASQRVGHAGRPIHFHGLRQSRFAVANHYGYRHDIRTALAFPLLTSPSE